MKEQVRLELWLLPVTCKKEVMQKGGKVHQCDDQKP